MPGSGTGVEVSRGERLLRQVQGLARDQGREADHHEEWAARHARLLPGLRHEDLQDRRGVVPAAGQRVGGARVMKVKDLMTSSPTVVRPEDTASQAATLMKQEDCGAIPVVADGGKLVGIVTDRDIVMRAVAAGKDPRSTPVSVAMSADPITLTPASSVDEAEKVMSDRQVRRLPVVEDGHLVGILVT